MEFIWFCRNLICHETFTLSVQFQCKHDFCWVCLEGWKKHSSATGGYFRCNRYEVVRKVEENNDRVKTDAEVKNKKMQELNKFIHYYTRFKNHENSYKVSESLPIPGQTYKCQLWWLPINLLQLITEQGTHPHCFYFSCWLVMFKPKVIPCYMSMGESIISLIFYHCSIT